MKFQQFFFRGRGPEAVPKFHFGISRLKILALALALNLDIIPALIEQG